MMTSVPCNGTNGTDAEFLRGVTLLVVSVLAVPVDLLIVVAIPTLNKWTTSDTLVMGLTIADLATCVTAVPMTVYAYFAGHCFADNSAGCYASAFFITLPRFAAMFIVTAIAIDRYVAMKRPFWHRSAVALQPSVMKRVVFCLWLLAAVLAALPFIGAKQVRFYSHRYYCFYEMDGWYNILIAAFGYGQLVIVLVCFIFVLKRINSIVENRRTLTRPNLILRQDSINRALEIVTNPNQSESTLPRRIPPKDRRLKRKKSLGVRSTGTTNETDMFHIERQFAKMFAILVLLFYVCWLPVVVICTINQNRHEQNEALLIWGLRFAVANCAINPIIYTLMRPQYRQVFKVLLRRMFCGRKPDRRELELIRSGSVLAKPRAGSLASLQSTGLQSTGLQASLRSLPTSVRAMTTTNQAALPRHTSLSSIVEEDFPSRESARCNRLSKDSTLVGAWRENIEIAEEAIRNSIILPSQSDCDSVVSISIDNDISIAELPEISRGTESTDSVLGNK